MFRQRIFTSQREDPNLQNVLSQLVENPVDGFSKSSDDRLLYQGRLCVLTIEEVRKEILTEAIDEVRKEILTEAHNSSFSMHPGGTKMYEDLKQHL